MWRHCRGLALAAFHRPCRRRGRALEQMEEYDDSLPTRKFDNFQFVDFRKTMSTARNPTAAFALSALIPDQYKQIKNSDF
ncbi:hypothetical protein DPMN_119990 [Dreissena polymorpha]|uniref:Copine C-terminal domain-containing protein n=1 Tax=Dreissena polymorpha TaxID=45954 RepID=A0A9D4GK93_DREPO|nr:hypothetical protein DPMN_119990 [Dreissena polymorpha]